MPTTSISHKKRKKKAQSADAAPAQEAHAFVTKPLGRETDMEQNPALEEVKVLDTDSSGMGEKKSLEKKKKMHGQKSAEDEHINQKLVEIYENSDGSMPNMKTFEKKKRRRIVRAFIVFVCSVILLGGVAWAGFFVFEPRASFSEEDVVLTISGPETIQSGKEVTYRVRYKNDQAVGLKDALLEVRYPAGFIFVTSSITTKTEQHNSWSLDTLDPHESGYIDMTGILNGTVGERQSFRLFLNYKPENFNSEFQKVAQATVLVDTSPVNLVVTAPPSISIGGVGEIKIEVSAVDAGMASSTVVVELDPADIFTKKSSNPESDSLNAYRWTLNSLASTTVITVNGSFVKPESQSATSTIVVRALKPAGQGQNAQEYILATQQVDMHFVETNIVASVAVNGSMGDTQATPGDVLNTSIVIKNTGESTLENATARMVWETPSYGNRSMLEWTQYDSEPDADIAGEQISPERRKGTITWDSRYIPDLKRINPSDEIFIDFTIPIRDASHAALSNFSGLDITGILELQYDENGEHKVIRSNPITITVISDLALEVRDDIQNVNGLDRHRVTLLLTNSFHDLQNLKIETEIYGDVEVSIDDTLVPAGTVMYDETTKKFLWVMESMPTDLDVRALQFDITLRSSDPSQKNLTPRVKVTATDTVVGQTITVWGDEILLR